MVTHQEQHGFQQQLYTIITGKVNYFGIDWGNVPERIQLQRDTSPGNILITAQRHLEASTEAWASITSALATAREPLREEERKAPHPPPSAPPQKNEMVKRLLNLRSHAPFPHRHQVCVTSGCSIQ